MGVLAQFDLFEICALVRLLFCTVIISAADCCIKVPVTGKSFSVREHDVVTTWE
jgi:hypothetical protein